MVGKSLICPTRKNPTAYQVTPYGALSAKSHDTCKTGPIVPPLSQVRMLRPMTDLLVSQSGRKRETLRPEAGMAVPRKDALWRCPIDDPWKFNQEVHC